MRKITVFVLLTALVLGVLPFVNSATYVPDNKFYWTCLSNGDKLAVWTCTHDCCVVCQKNGYNNYPEDRCAGLPRCSCGSNSQPGDIQPPVITLNMPFNNTISGSRSIQFSIATDEKADYYYKDSADERRGFKKICPNCLSYNGKISFADGQHTITILAADANNNQAEKPVSFFIDSQKPKIRSTLPKSKGYTNGTFVVTYDELNLQKVKLMYNQGPGYNEVVRTDCPKGVKQECSFFVHGMSQTPLTYYFILEDPVNTVQSKEVKTIYVDTVVPTMTITLPESISYKGGVPFDVDVSEDVTLEYRDNSQKTPRWNKFCSKCDNYARKRSFSRGSHAFDIRATDLAGNSVQGSVSFIVE
jgi:hypothetical protein